MEFFLKIYDHSDYETRDQNLTIYDCYIYIKLIIKLLNIIQIGPCHLNKKPAPCRVLELYTGLVFYLNGMAQSVYVSYHKQQFGFQRVQRLYTRVALAAKGSRW